MSAPFSVEAWERCLENDRRGRLQPGWDHRLEQGSDGVHVEFKGPRNELEHPWSVRCAFLPRPENPRENRWRAFVRPGFVNGRDVMVTSPVLKFMRIDGRNYGVNPLSGRPYFSAWVFSTEGAVKGSLVGSAEVPLTDEQRPSLELSFRNPLAPGSLAVTTEGAPFNPAGEGYPPYFVALGVRPSAVDSREAPAKSDPNRTREIRAADLYVQAARIGTRSEVTVGDVVGDARIITIGAKFLNDYARNAPSQYRLRATPKWGPPPEPTQLDRLLGTAVEPQTDEIKIATIWMVSPPNVATDAEPDGTWAAYAQYSVFENLMLAGRNRPPAVPPPPIRLLTNLALGTADTIFAGLLDPANRTANAITNFFTDTDYKGFYWTT